MVEEECSDPGIEVEDDDDDEMNGTGTLKHNGSGTSSRNSDSLGSLPRLDSYRFSLANMEQSQDVDLDAIIGELCALESQFEREINSRGYHNNNVQPRHKVSTLPGHFSGISTASSSSSSSGASSQRSSAHSNGVGGRPKFEIGPFGTENGTHTNGDHDPRTESPDNDSAFSDNVSMLSSESSASSGGGAQHRKFGATHVNIQNGAGCESASPMQNFEDILAHLRDVVKQPEHIKLTPSEQSARLKAEKIKIALEKMKEASIQKLFIKAFCADGSAKSLLVDERMSVAHVTRLLAEKNHVALDPHVALVEYIPELYMERIYEDHENLVENLLLWTRESSNRIMFVERSDKYDLFVNPERYLLSGSSSETDREMDDDAKMALLDEFFLPASTPGLGVPEVEGLLYLKSDGKKTWKKHFFVLRASGLYYCPKGKSKLSKDLVCLTTFEMSNVYTGFGWKKKHKAPTDFGFAVKHPQIQTKSSKYIKYLCTEDAKTLRKWLMGIRVAKYGRQLKDNFENVTREIVEDDLETLAYARSFSLSSMAKQMAVSPDSGSPEGAQNSAANNNNINGRPVLRHSISSDSTITLCDMANGTIRHDGTLRRRASISSSSGGSSLGSMSNRSSSSSSACTPTSEHAAAGFDVEQAPGGTIKRKPCLTAKIPLTTSTTLSLAKQQSVDAERLNGTCSLVTTTAAGRSATLNHNNNNNSAVAGTCFNAGSLGRNGGTRFSFRRSKTDDQLSATLARFKQNRVAQIASEQQQQQMLQQQQREQQMLQHHQDQMIQQQHMMQQQQQLEQHIQMQQQIQIQQQMYQQQMQQYQQQELYHQQQQQQQLRNGLMRLSVHGSLEDISEGPSLSQCENVSGSSLSLDSLPPPPPPLDGTDNWPSVSSLCSLPPPPSNLVTPTNSPPRSETSSNQVTPTASPGSTSNQPTPTNEFNGLPGQQVPHPQAFPRNGNPSYPVSPCRTTSLTNGVQYNGVSPSQHTAAQSQYNPSIHQVQNRYNPNMPQNVSACFNPIYHHTNGQQRPNVVYQQPMVNPNGPQFNGMPQVSHSSGPFSPQNGGANELPLCDPNRIYQRTPVSPNRIPGGTTSNEAAISSPKGGGTPQKPPPPRRSENTRLSTTSSSPAASNSPSRRSFSSPPGPGQLTSPPQTFLQDLHRVMDKKWKVAQTLNTNVEQSAHEVLGFRDPRYLSAEEQQQQRQKPTKQVQFVLEEPKRRPPPPPKRSESTQLSRRP